MVGPGLVPLDRQVLQVGGDGGSGNLQWLGRGGEGGSRVVFLHQWCLSP